MNTLRHYFISDDLDDLDLLEDQLESRGVDNPQIHVLSNDDPGVANHVHLHAVQSLLKNDVIHSAEIGAVAGSKKRIYRNGFAISGARLNSERLTRPIHYFLQTT